MKSLRCKRIVRRVVIVALCMTAFGLIVLWIVAGALVAPNPSSVGEPPHDLNAISFSIPSESGSTISGWHTQLASSNGVIVLLHGIRSSRLSMLDRALLFHNAGYSTVLIDFQAHGESPGDTITIGYLEKHDVRAAVEFARTKHPDEPIGVVGVSLGGAAALLASPLNIDALVLESVYPNIQDAIRNRVAIKLGPISSLTTSLLVLQLQFRLGISTSDLRPIDFMSDVNCPVFVMSGSEDKHTTEKETRLMFSAAKEPKQLWLVEGAAHVDLLVVDPKIYRQQIVGFFDRQLRDRGQ